MYITSQGAVFKLNLKTKAYSTFAGTGTRGTAVDNIGTSAEFVRAHACAFDKSGTLYIADELDIRKITPAGNVTTILRDLPCIGCTEIYIGTDGQIMVADNVKDKLYRVNMTDFSFVPLAGSSSSGYNLNVHFQMVLLPLRILKELYKTDMGMYLLPSWQADLYHG